MSTNDAVIQEFRNNEGRVGGHWVGRDLLLLTTIGHTTGADARRRRFTRATATG